MTLIAKAARQDRIKKKIYILLSSFLFLKIDIHIVNVNLLSYLISWSSVLKWMVCYFFTHWHVELQYWGSTDDCFFLCSCIGWTYSDLTELTLISCSGTEDTELPISELINLLFVFKVSVWWICFLEWCHTGVLKQTNKHTALCNNNNSKEYYEIHTIYVNF